MKKLFFLILLFITSYSWSQPTFYKQFSGNGYDQANGVAVLDDSTYLVTGSSTSLLEGPSQAFVMNLSKTGVNNWIIPYGGSESESGIRILNVKNTGSYVLGWSTSGPSGDFDLYSFFIDQSGFLQWEKRWDFGAWERFHDAILLKDSTVLAVGELEYGDGNIDGILVHLNLDGDTISTRKYTGNQAQSLHGITRISDTTYALAGTTYNSDSLMQKGLLEYWHIDGTNYWSKQVGKSGNYRLNDVEFDGIDRIAGVGYGQRIGKTDKDVLNVWYFLNGNSNGDYDYYAQYDATYNHVTRTNVGGTTNYVLAYQQKDNPNIPTFSDGEDSNLGIYSSDMWWTYVYTYCDLGQDEIGEVAQTLDGSAIAVGHKSIGPGGGSMWVSKSDLSGVFLNTTTPYYWFLTASLDEIIAGLEVYPNPAENQISIKLPSSNFNIELLNPDGKLLLTEMGYDNKTISLETLESGVYFARISSNGKQTVHRILKL